MGLFLQAAILPKCRETDVRNAVEAVAEKGLGGFDDAYEGMYLIPEECRYKEYDGGVSILLNEDCCGYEALAEALSKEIETPVLLLYIYDGDYWGFFLYEKGLEMDRFSPVPDYFEDVSTEEIEKEKGNAEMIAKYFHVDKASIEKYLVFWSEELLEKDMGKAYEDDEFQVGEDWQMADFMRKLGFPYEWE